MIKRGEISGIGIKSTGELQLEAGKMAYAIIKATSVMIGVDD